MNKNVKIGLFGILIVLLTGCGTFEKAARINPSTNYFDAKKKKQESVVVLKKVLVNADTLKTLLVVSTTDYWLQMGQYLNYFDEVLTYDQFQTAIIKAGLSEKIPNVSDKVGLNRAYSIYKPFVILNLTKVKKEGGWFAGLTLYDPSRAETIFENEIWLNLMWDGWTDQGTMFPLFNSLLDYLREQN